MGEQVSFEGYRGLTLSVRSNEAAQVHYAGVVEWNRETSVSVTSAEAATRVAKGAVDAHLDRGEAPAKTLNVGFAESRITQAKGIIVPTDSGDYTVFHHAGGTAENDDPYLDKEGWYYQPLDFDEPPAGPYDDHVEASEEAVTDGAKPHPAP